ncbi:hypothetical protein BDR07DRAFT_1380280 [Suillus spraguei]|nr:hypothetical protein BDR07DRAFT_1380280 [Suillus spraguei]
MFTITIEDYSDSSFSDSSSISSNSEPENELSTFESIGRYIDYISSATTAYEVHRETKLTRALDNLSGSPFVSFKSQENAATLKLLVKGEDAGTWMEPAVEVLQKHATPSPFGRGKETVMDPTYRHGTELKADDLAFSLDDEYNILTDGKNVTLKLYKLAIYGEGGHFDWHRDSTQSDAHHGTVLVALNTEWEGRELMLRHQGVETTSGDQLRPVVVAFYTDTEHKVVPVTKGTRLVLQYDVEVVQQPPEDRIPLPGYTPLKRAVDRHQHIHIASHIHTYPNLDQKSVQAVVDEIRELHKEGIHIGSDSALFDALENHFNVALHPVLIRAIEDGEGDDSQELFFAHKYKSPEKIEEEPSSGGVLENASFHLPQTSAILQLSLPTGMHLGNQADISGEARYFGAGVFVEPKSE